VTVKQHGFIQEVYLDGYGNVAQRKIEQAMGLTKMGVLSGSFKDLEAREKRGGRPASLAVRDTRGRPMYSISIGVFASCEK
jgi:hypothetical protein